jgi:phosphate-selective porin OprO and OprP
MPRRSCRTAERRPRATDRWRSTGEPLSIAALAVAVALHASSPVAAQPADNDRPRPAAEERRPLSFDSDGIAYRAFGGGLVLTLGGRLHIDLAAYDGEEETDFDDDPEVRRARLELEAQAFDTWDATFQYDFADDDEPVKDALLEYSGIDGLALTVGNFDEPFSLEELTSSNDITFLERSLPTLFAPGRNVGIAARAYRDRGTLTAGVYGGNINRSIEEDGVAVGARATYLPLTRDRRLVHLGVAVNHRAPGGDEDVSFGGTPESAVAAVDLVETDAIADVDGITRLGLEAATVLGPFSLQGEYVRALVARDGADAELDGAYALASWILTGEARQYVKEEGIFGAVEPDRPVGSPGGIGAWEVAARYSTVDLDDGPVQGGRERNYTLGLNWYPTANLRVLGNYVRAETRGSVPDEDIDIFQIRFQIAF